MIVSGKRQMCFMKNNCSNVNLIYYLQRKSLSSIGTSSMGGSANAILGGSQTTANTHLPQYRQSISQSQNPPSFFQNRYPYVNASPESALSPSISSVATSTSEVCNIYA